MLLRSISSLLLVILVTSIPLPASNAKGQESLKDFVFVEGGTFIMGDGLFEDQMEHEVTVSDFYIRTHEVTYKEWKEFTDDFLTDFDWANASLLNYHLGISGGYADWQDDMPMFNLSWFQAIKYCNWLSQKHGLEPAYSYEEDPATVKWNRQANGYRLPTEAEWEYAAIGGKKSQGYKYAGSDDIDEVGWYKTFSRDRPRPVKSKKPNELGLYDMTGNVAEWCWDYFDINYYNVSPPIDPTGPDVGYGPGQFMTFDEERQAKVYRGGGWETTIKKMSVRYRAAAFYYEQHRAIGIRLVRNAQ